MDDLVVPGRNEEEARQRLERVFAKAQEYGLEIKWSKCQFLKRKIEFLGHMIENGRVSPSPAKVAAVRNYPKPKTIADIHSFLGLTGYFRKYIPNYAKIAKPLSDLLRGEKIFRFGLEQEKAFAKLKARLMSDPVLIIYNPAYKTELHTVASSHGFGAVLMQKLPKDGRFHLVHYMSIRSQWKKPTLAMSSKRSL